MAEDDNTFNDKLAEPTEKLASEPKRKAAFDDLLKFGRYTKFLTLVFFLLLTVQSLQLLFMSFGGASPKVKDVLCNGTRPSGITPDVLKKISFACEKVAEIEKETGEKCEIKTEYKFGSIHRTFGVECDPNAVHYSTSFQNMGLIVGTLISGYFANKYGRKYTLMGVLLLLSLLLLASTFAKDIISFTVLRFLVMMCAAGSHNVSHLFVIENLPPKWRSIMPTYLSYPVGFLMTAIIGKFSGDWKILTYASAFITILPMILMGFTVETPSFLFGRANLVANKKKSGEVKLEAQGPDATDSLLKEEEKACRKRARDAALKCDTFLFSKKSSDFDEKWKAAAVQQRINEIASKMAAEDSPQKQSSGIFSSPFFSDKRLVCFTAILSYGIVTLSTTTYGVLTGISHIPGEIWVNIALSAVVSYLCNWVAIATELICGKLNHPLWSGRRQLHIGFGSLTLTLILALLFVDLSGNAASGNAAWEMVVRLLAWSIVGACTELYIVYHVQCSETYPTPVRAIGCSIVQAASRLGNSFGALLNVTKTYGSFFPFLIMAVLFSLELVLYLNYSYGLCGQKTEEQSVIRETKGKPKPEFMQSQGKNFNDYLQSVKLTNEDLAEFDEKSA